MKEELALALLYLMDLYFGPQLVLDKIYKKRRFLLSFSFESANQQKRGLQIAEKHKTKVGSYVTFQVFAQNLIHTATF